MMINTDCLLIQASTDEAGARSIPTSAPWLSAVGQVLGQEDVLHARPVWSAAQQSLYLYVDLPHSTGLESRQMVTLEEGLKRSFPTLHKLRASRLSRAFDKAGASRGAHAAQHYVVETDPEAGWQEELMRWYDTEHMPGLASVQGCIRAQRFLNHDHGPLSYACYDLVTEDTLGSEAWLAVRHTGWSSRVRPHFTNTKRTMFSCL
ncbi:MAG: hypothetical protein KJ852_14170 [Gammaproteobacteria bacterium]|nr:hypothetical protein [Gammaproteobacteria bacterium]MBU0788483.1 hypothetical protein [Gammaproteobacteria bacterium]MBU0815693.1 hypothetical protein [Gammaproteobacteria bacterium]MBU1788099.1 hypothetical protein [Gammaproteobacteria bacterium]